MYVKCCYSGRDSCQPYLQGAGRQPGEWEADGGVREAGQRGEKQLQPDSPTLSLSCTSSPCNTSIIVQFKLNRFVWKLSYPPTDFTRSSSTITAGKSIVWWVKIQSPTVTETHIFPTSISIQAIYCYRYITFGISLKYLTVNYQYFICRSPFSNKVVDSLSNHAVLFVTGKYQSTYLHVAIGKHVPAIDCRYCLYCELFQLVNPYSDF